MFDFKFNGSAKFKEDLDFREINHPGCPEIRHIGKGRTYKGSKIDEQENLCFIDNLPLGSYQLYALYFKEEKKEIVFYRSKRPEFSIQSAGVYLFPEVKIQLDYLEKKSNRQRSSISIKNIENIASNKKNQKNLLKLLKSKKYQHLDWHSAEIRALPHLNFTSTNSPQ